jgi:CelD/BcsL family acetyltransferase involved in cellulose biosynthesis
MPGCPWIPLDESWLQPEQHLNAGRRSDLRRACRSAEQFGPITYDILRPTPTELPALLDEAFQVEAAGWKGQSRSALQYDAVRGPFYRRYAETACEQGILRLCFLRLGGQAVAMQLAVEHNKAFWLLKIGYDEAFARCSPGTLLLLETIRYAAAHGLHSYEFLGTPASWTRVWTLLERPCVSLWAYPARMRGVAALAVDATTAVRRKLGRVVQEWI